MRVDFFCNTLRSPQDDDRLVPCAVPAGRQIGGSHLPFAGCRWRVSVCSGVWVCKCAGSTNKEDLESAVIRASLVVKHDARAGQADDRGRDGRWWGRWSKSHASFGGRKVPVLFTVSGRSRLILAGLELCFQGKVAVEKDDYYK